jgi:2-hydroxychromene-2-carboxylate isomerase/membrane associated rhomboid family serine protease
LQPRLEFFFDCSSPWTYLAFVRLLKLANRASIDLIWKPTLVGGVFNKVNADVYKQRETPNPVKAAYYRKDLADWAAFTGITIIKPTIFPVRSVNAMRGCFYAIQHGHIIEYARNLFEAYWRDDRDISQDSEIEACAHGAGLDGLALLEAAKSNSAKQQLIANTEELIARGGFGSPTFFVNTTDMNLLKLQSNVPTQEIEAMQYQEPDQNDGGDSGERPVSQGSPPSARRREPIFNKTPLGVAGLIGAILTAHLVSLLSGPIATQNAQMNFGVVPERILAEIGNNQFGSALVSLIAHQFMHGGTLHLVMNLAMLLQAGPIAEVGLGRNRDSVARFIVFFVACGICGGLTYCAINPTSLTPTIGASGAISGVFAGFLWAAIGLAKPGQAMLRPVLTSAAVFLLINVGLAWVGRVLNFMPIAWESHLGGFLAGLILYPLIARAGRAKATSV